MRAIALILPLLISCIVAPLEAVAQTQTHYVEFRGRWSNIVGHAYMVVGRLGSGGKRTQTDQFGFYPDVPQEQFVKAGLLGANGKVGILREDRTVPVATSFTVSLTETQHRRAMAVVHSWRKRRIRFHAIEANCNKFVAEVARAAGLSAPNEFAILPPVYVRSMAVMNRQLSGRARGRRT